MVKEMRYEDFPKEDASGVLLKIVKPRSLHYSKTGIPRLYDERECILQLYQEEAGQSVALRYKWDELEIVQENKLLKWLRN